jgi:hypothetical protein
VALSLPDHWLWDFWIADDRTAYHLFFLKAPRVGDPDLRHWNTSVGHAISTDLVQWQVVADALTPSTEPAFDDLATWTGSVVRGDDDTWYLFYTGLSMARASAVLWSLRTGTRSRTEMAGEGWLTSDAAVTLATLFPGMLTIRFGAASLRRQGPHLQDRPSDSGTRQRDCSDPQTAVVVDHQERPS